MYIEPSSVYNKELYETISYDCNCVICENILKNPVICQVCKNSFCFECIEKWKKESQNCPFRCKNPGYKPDKAKRELLSKIKFKCQNGCGNVINYDDLENHYKEFCTHINFKEALKEIKKEANEIQEEHNFLESIFYNLKKSIEAYSKNPFQLKMFFSKYHRHLLKFDKRRNYWICDRCRKNYDIQDKSFFCEECDFDICCECYYEEYYLHDS